MRALDAYHALEPREKLLVRVAGVMLGLFFLWQFIISPVMDARQNAAQRQANALRDYAIVESGLPAVTTSRFRGNRDPFSRLAVSQTAQAAQLTISRLEPVDGGAFKIWFEDVPSPQVFGFMQAVSTGYAVELSKVQINRGKNGQVNAQITLSPEGS